MYMVTELPLNLNGVQSYNDSNSLSMVYMVVIYGTLHLHLHPDYSGKRQINTARLAQSIYAFKNNNRLYIIQYYCYIRIITVTSIIQE